MINIINFLIIVIIWSILFLIINTHKDTFRLYPFIPWGTTLQGCINRCQISSNQNLDESECKTICNKCSSKNCNWKHQEDIITAKTNNNKFIVQVIPFQNSAKIQWKYTPVSEKQQSIDKITEPIFSKNETFKLYMEDEDNSDNPVPIFKYNETKKSFISTNGDYEITTVYEVIKKNYPIIEHDDHDWYLIRNTDSGSASLISNHPVHPLNARWSTSTPFKNYSKIKNVFHKFILQLINTDNVNAGIMIHNRDTLLPNKVNPPDIYETTIDNLHSNTNYKLSIYPLFIDQNSPKELSDIISFSTDDEKFDTTTTDLTSSDK